MALFEYRAIDKSGKNQKGKIDSPSIKQATSKLRAKGLHLVSISDPKEKQHNNSKVNKVQKKSDVPAHVITNFTRQLSILISTGIPYDKAFDIMMKESENTKFQQVLSNVKSQIIEGSSLAEALDSYPSLFTKMYIAMVKAGEASGKLDLTLNQLVKSRETNEELLAKIQHAMIYPIIMTVLGLTIVVFMVSFIIPKIVPIFNQFDIALPLPTSIVITLSNFVIQNAWSLIIFFVIFIFTFQRALKTDRGEFIRDWILLKIPIVKGIIEKILVYRFTQTLGTLLISGVDLKQSLDIVKKVLGNRVFEDKFHQISIDITQKGMDLSQALRQTSVFPSSVIQMIRVGEESSKLEQMLEKVSDISEIEVKRTLEKSVALIEPIMLGWMTLMVGFIILAVMLPMLKMNQLI